MTAEQQLELGQAAICDALNAPDVTNAQWKELRAAAEAQGIDRVIIDVRRGGKTVGTVEVNCRPIRQTTIKSGRARRLPDGTIAFEMQEVTRGA